MFHRGGGSLALPCPSLSIGNIPHYHGIPLTLPASPGRRPLYHPGSTPRPKTPYHRPSLLHWTSSPPLTSYRRGGVAGHRADRRTGDVAQITAEVLEDRQPAVAGPGRSPVSRNRRLCRPPGDCPGGRRTTRDRKTRPPAASAARMAPSGRNVGAKTVIGCADAASACKDLVDTARRPYDAVVLVDGAGPRSSTPVPPAWWSSAAEDGTTVSVG